MRNGLTFRAKVFQYISPWPSSLVETVRPRIPHIPGNCHELRMRLSEVVCGNMPGFIRPFFVHGICSFVCSDRLFRRQRPVKCGGAVLPSLHRCRLESNLKSSGFFCKLNCSWQFPLKLCLCLSLVLCPTHKLALLRNLQGKGFVSALLAWG